MDRRRNLTRYLVFMFLGAYLRGNGDQKETGGWMMVAGVICLIVVAIWSGTTSFKPINSGEIGVVYQFGNIIGQIGEGPNWIAPYQSIKTENIQVQGHKFEKLESFSSETQNVLVKATLNIRVAPEAIQKLYRTVGPNWYAVLVEPRVQQNFKDETVKYKSVDIAPNRETIRKTVRDRLEGELSPHSIEVVDLLLDNIDFDKDFKNAIEAKQIATQRALEEEQKVNVSKHQATQKVETAKGEGGAIFEVAKKQAEANDKLSASLTPQLIQYSLIQKLGDDIKVIILPTGQNFILDSSILGGVSPTPIPLKK